MIPKEELRRTLIYIKNKNFQTTMQYDAYELSLEAIKYIGDPDPNLRDDLVLTYLEAMILNHTINDSQVKTLLNICLNNLNFGLGKIDDSVFTRTCSMLIIAIIIYRHRNYPFLNKGEINQIFEKIIYTYKNDQDVRGFVEGKGWAYGAANGADIFFELSLLKDTENNDMRRILDAIYHKVKVGHYGYIHNEDERMARVVSNIIRRNIISENQIYEWIQKFELQPAIGSAYIVRRTNIRNFLRCLYFQLHPEYTFLCNTILRTIEKNHE
ncbi:MAG TPA: DUF2785 domain-containing protein [Acholeplasmataceae bacterium]|nr:DUF2785 domain-containing protein [Acholeplasmataceae bacterium]